MFHFNYMHIYRHSHYFLCFSLRWSKVDQLQKQKEQLSNADASAGAMNPADKEEVDQILDLVRKEEPARRKLSEDDDEDAAKEVVKNVNAAVEAGKEAKIVKLLAEDDAVDSDAEELDDLIDWRNKDAFKRR